MRACAEDHRTHLRWRPKTRACAQHQHACAQARLPCTPAHAPCPPPPPRSYVTPGRVIIRDKRLGFLHLFLTMAILLYIGVYQLLYLQVYRKEVGGQAAGAGG